MITSAVPFDARAPPAMRSPDGQMLAFASRMKKDSLRIAHLPSCTVFANWRVSGFASLYLYFSFPSHAHHRLQALSRKLPFACVGGSRGVRWALIPAPVVCVREHSHPAGRRARRRCTTSTRWPSRPTAATSRSATPAGGCCCTGCTTTTSCEARGLGRAVGGKDGQKGGGGHFVVR